MTKEQALSEILGDVILGTLCWAPEEAPAEFLSALRERGYTILPTEDGVALRSIVHPCGLEDKIADAIRDGRLRLDRDGPA